MVEVWLFLDPLFISRLELWNLGYATAALAYLNEAGLDEGMHPLLKLSNIGKHH